MVNWEELHNYTNRWLMENLPPIDDIDYYNFKEEPFDTSFYTDYEDDLNEFVAYNHDDEYNYEDNTYLYNESSSDSEEDNEYYD
jgi:hypothetical protein